MTHQGHHFIALPYSHMACLREIPEVEVVRGSDPFRTARFVLKPVGVHKPLFRPPQDAGECERLDVVTVATNAGPRHHIVMDCVEVGLKAIYAEKPLALTLSDADEMVSAAQAKGVTLAVGCTRRSDPWWQEVRKLIASGQIGNVLHVNALGECGISLNGSHMIDLVRFLVGDEILLGFR